MAFPCPDPADAETQLHGVRGRMGKICPEPKPKVLRAFRRFCALESRKLFKPIPPEYDFDFERWLERTSYSDKRKMELRELKASHFKPQRAWWKVKLHTKRESYPCYKNARGIYARTDDAKVELGPIVKAIEDVVYEHESSVKHMTMGERPAHMIKVLGPNEGLCYETDYSAFESSMKPELMKCQHEIYKWILQFHPNECNLLVRNTNCRNKISSKYLRVECDARRMSGEMDTALGNWLVNFFVLKFLAYRNNSDVKQVVEGDDGLFRVLGEWKPCPKDWAELGFLIKIDERPALTAASFCGLVCDTEEMVNIADPLRKILNFGWSFSTRSLHTRKQSVLEGLLLAKAMSLACELPRCPMVWAVSRRTLEHLKGVSPIWDEDRWKLQYVGSTVPVPSEPGVRTRELFKERYGFSVEAQLAFEEYILTRDDPLSPIYFPEAVGHLHPDVLSYSMAHICAVPL